MTRTTEVTQLLPKRPSETGPNSTHRAETDCGGFGELEILTKVEYLLSEAVDMDSPLFRSVCEGQTNLYVVRANPGTWTDDTHLGKSVFGVSINLSPR